MYSQLHMNFQNVITPLTFDDLESLSQGHFCLKVHFSHTYLLHFKSQVYPTEQNYGNEWIDRILNLTFDLGILNLTFDLGILNLTFDLGILNLTFDLLILNLTFDLG